MKHHRFDLDTSYCTECGVGLEAVIFDSRAGNSVECSGGGNVVAISHRIAAAHMSRERSKVGITVPNTLPDAG